MLTRPNVIVPDQNEPSPADSLKSSASSSSASRLRTLASPLHSRQARLKSLREVRGRAERFWSLELVHFPLHLGRDQRQEPLAVVVPELRGIVLGFEHGDELFGH